MASGGKSGRSEGAGTGGNLDYGAIYAAARESNARLRYWIYSIYGLHGMAPPPLYRAPYTPSVHTAMPGTLRLLLSTRCLVLELWSFQATLGHYSQIKDGLEVKKKGGLTMIIKNHKISGQLRDLRGKLAHSGITLGEFASEIGLLGMDSLVSYAHAALMLEDAAFEAVPNSHRPAAWEWRPSEHTFGLPAVSDMDAFAKKYSRINFALDMGIHRRDCTIMNELNLSLHMLYGGFYRSARHVADSATQISRLRLDDHMRNAKYMFIDIDCFITKFEKLGLHNAVTPGFISRKQLYRELRHDYSAHTRTGRMPSLKAVLGKHPRLLDDMLLDIVEIDVLSALLLEGLDALPMGEIPPITRKQVDKIDQKLRSVQIESHRRYGYRYVEHYDGSEGREARERASRELGPA